jgi:TonB family protein
MKRYLTVLLLCAGISISAYASTPPSALSSIPADCPSILGINVRQLAASPFFARLTGGSPGTGSLPAGLAKLTENTGIDPVRDISYLIMAATSVEKTKPHAVVIVSGTFDRDRIVGYVRSQMGSVEMDYGGASLFMIPEMSKDGIRAGISFLGAQELALGDMDLLKAVLDTRSGAQKSILSNPDMNSLLGNIQYEDMFWFAANPSEVLKNTPITTPLGPSPNSIRNSYGSLNISDNATGRITAIAADLDSATKIANVFRGLIAFGQLSGSKNPDLKLLVDRITVTQNEKQISLAFDIPGDLLKKFGTTKFQQMGMPGKPTATPAPKATVWQRVSPAPEGVVDSKTPGLKPPVALEQPLPPYTEEARKAGISGNILLQLIVRKDGTMDSFKIMQGLGYGLDESAIDTIAHRWRFKPGTLDGTPVNTRILVDVSFKLFKKPTMPQPQPAR